MSLIKNSEEPMKLIQSFFLFLCIFFNITLPIEQSLTPKNTIICSDLDDVLIKTSPWLIPNLIYSILTHDPLAIWTYLTTLYHAKKSYTKDADGQRNPLLDQYGNTINGLTFHLLFQGMHNNAQLAPYVHLILNTVENSRCFIMGTKKIYQYLKGKKGYTIVFATNNDHLAYKISEESLGNDLTDLADYIFVAQPGNNDQVIAQLQEFANQTPTPINYKNVLLAALTIQPTKTILHAPSKKPDHEYYDYIEQNLGTDKNIIFIDDRKENVDGFNNRENKSNSYHYGIQFKNPVQLADELIALGILSETNDAPLLEEIRHPGVINQIKISVQKIIGYLGLNAVA